MGHGVLKTCFRSVKIVSRFPKSCHVFPSEPNMHSASEIVTRLPNRVTILHFHEDSILSHIPTFSTLTLNWWRCHFNHQPSCSLTLPWTIPQDKTNQVQRPAWTLIHTPTSTCIQPPSVVPQASKSYSLHPTTLCSSTSFLTFTSSNLGMPSALLKFLASNYTRIFR
jgi:hypothetical protein